MLHRSLTSEHDWIFGKGKNSYWNENKAIMNNIKTRLLSFKYDCFFDVDFGVDWWNLLGGKDLNSLLYQIRSMIATSYGVAEIVNMEYNLKNRVFSITFSVKLVNNDIEQDTVEVFSYA